DALRSAAVNGMANVGKSSRNIADVLRTMLRDDTNGMAVRRSASQGLGKSEFGQSAVDDLLKVIEKTESAPASDEVAEMRVATFEAISKMQPNKSALPTLITAFVNPRS